MTNPGTLASTSTKIYKLPTSFHVTDQFSEHYTFIEKPAPASSTRIPTPGEIPPMSTPRLTIDSSSSASSTPTTTPSTSIRSLMSDAEEAEAVETETEDKWKKLESYRNLQKQKESSKHAIETADQPFTFGRTVNYHKKLTYCRQIGHPHSTDTHKYCLVFYRDYKNVLEESRPPLPPGFVRCKHTCRPHTKEDHKGICLKWDNALHAAKKSARIQASTIENPICHSCGFATEVHLKICKYCSTKNSYLAAKNRANKQKNCPPGQKCCQICLHYFPENHNPKRNACDICRQRNWVYPEIESCKNLIPKLLAPFDQEQRKRFMEAAESFAEKLFKKFQTFVEDASSTFAYLGIGGNVNNYPMRLHASYEADYALLYYEDNRDYFVTILSEILFYYKVIKFLPPENVKNDPRMLGRGAHTSNYLYIVYNKGRPLRNVRNVRKGSAGSKKAKIMNYNEVAAFMRKRINTGSF